MYRSLALLCGGFLSLWAASSSGQDAVLGQLYGRGVHTYFSRDYAEAYRYLTKAIESGTKDPRTYYFRGMTYLQLGREEEARMDFEKGAELESGDVNRFYDVAKSLERIQGNGRLLLEDYRFEARMAARQRAEQLHKARYETIRQNERSILQEQIDVVPQVPPADVISEPIEQNPFQEDPLGQPGGSPFEEPPADPLFEEPAGDPLFEEPPADPLFEEPPQPVAQPGGGEKSGGVLGGMMRALGKAAAGDELEPPAEPGDGGAVAPFDPATLDAEPPLDPFEAGEPDDMIPVAPGDAQPLDPFEAAEPAVPTDVTPAAPGDDPPLDPFEVGEPAVPTVVIPAAPGDDPPLDPFEAAEPAVPTVEAPDAPGDGADPPLDPFEAAEPADADPVADVPDDPFAQ